MDSLETISTYTADGDGDEVEIEDVTDMLVRYKHATHSIWTHPSSIIYRQYTRLRVIVVTMNRLVHSPNVTVFPSLSVYWLRLRMQARFCMIALSLLLRRKKIPVLFTISPPIHHQNKLNTNLPSSTVNLVHEGTSCLTLKYLLRKDHGVIITGLLQRLSQL